MIIGKKEINIKQPINDSKLGAKRRKKDNQKQLPEAKRADRENKKQTTKMKSR